MLVAQCTQGWPTCIKISKAFGSVILENFVIVVEPVFESFMEIDLRFAENISAAI